MCTTEESVRRVEELERPVCDIKTVAAVLGVSERHVGRLANEGRINGAFRVGRCWRFNSTAIKELAGIR